MARRKKILCAFPPSRDFSELAKLLKQAGFSVVTAHSFHSALQWLRTEAPDAVLVDDAFSTVDGLSSADIISAILPHALVVFLGADGPKSPAIVQTLTRRLGSRQVHRADASGS